MKYKIEGNKKLIVEKCKMKFDYDISQDINENNELIISDDNYYKIAEIISEFLAPLGLVVIERTSENE